MVQTSPTPSTAETPTAVPAQETPTPTQPPGGAGGGVLKVAEALAEGIPRDDIGTIIVGAAVVSAVGWLAIRYLLRLVERGSYMPFVAYRLLVGVFVLIYFAA